MAQGPSDKLAAPDPFAARRAALREEFFARLFLLGGWIGGTDTYKRTMWTAVPDIALQTLATGVGPITSIAQAGDSRLFLALQTGRIVIYARGQIQPGAFLDLTALVSCCIERGLQQLSRHRQ